MLNTIAVSAEDASLITEAQNLAQQLSLNYFTLKSPLKFVKEYDYLLVLSTSGVALAKTGKGAPKPVSVDFTSGAVDHRRRFGGGKGQDIAKAVGLNKRGQLSVLDATAGLGRDAFVLASLGCRMHLCERVGFVRALLKDGLYRASLNEEVAVITQEMTLLDGDIKTLSGQAYDVVYLDPMFPHMEKSSAAAKKEMAFFRDLVGPDLDADELLPMAMSLAQYRVVVKRPKGAPFLNASQPTYQLEGKSGRFDIYVIKSLDAEI